MRALASRVKASIFTRENGVKLLKLIDISIPVNRVETWVDASEARAGRRTGPCLAMALGMALGAILPTLGPAAAQTGAPPEAPAETPAEIWSQTKCRLYSDAFARAIDERGTTGLGPEFLLAHQAFLDSGCTGTRDVCPRSQQELALADLLSVVAINEGMTGSFLPFACPR